MSKPHSSHPPIINISGERVALGPLHRDLTEMTRSWYNDFAVIRSYAPLPRPITAEQWAVIYEQATTSERDIWFLIFVIDGWRPIGFTGLQQVDFENRTAEYAILIGETDAWGKGYGTEVTQLMRDYAFDSLGLISLHLRVYEYNLGGVRAYERAGFRHAGRLRQTKSMGGQLWDTILMDCLAAEVESSSRAT